MTPAELSACLDRLGLTMTFAARILGVNDRTFRMWLAGEKDIPELTARVVRLLDQKKLFPADLVEARTKD